MTHGHMLSGWMRGTLMVAQGTAVCVVGAVIKIEDCSKWRCLMFTMSCQPVSGNQSLLDYTSAAPPLLSLSFFLSVPLGVCVSVCVQFATGDIWAPYTKAWHSSVSHETQCQPCIHTFVHMRFYILHVCIGIGQIQKSILQQ